MIDALIREFEQYGMLKGIPVCNHNGGDYYISVTDIKKILESHREKHETVDSYMRKLEKPAAYIRTLDSKKLFGYGDCRIFYINHVGDIENIKRWAEKHNNILIKLSKEDFNYYKRMEGSNGGKR